MKLLQTFLQEDGTRRYSVLVPDFIAERESYDHYEKDRFLSMEMNLKPGDVLFDIGAETGWQSAIYAKFVGPENMCLFEHVRELWPSIKQVWEANNFLLPRFAFCGFVSNRSFNAPWYRMNRESGGPPWPPVAFELKPLVDFSTWSMIHADTRAAELAIDRFIEVSGIIPKALTIDVEGSEYRVLQGARATLAEHRPLVWVSIHPEVRLRSFGTSKNAILDFMYGLDYDWQYLGVDHEEHYFLYPTERQDAVAKVESPWKTNGTRHETFEQKMPNWQDSMGMPYAQAWGKND